MVHPTTTESRKAPPPSTSSSHDDKTSPSPSKKLKPSCATGDTAVVSTTKSKSNVKSSDGKINGNISKMFSKQQSSIDKEFEFVEKNAPITKPQGYASATKQLKMVQEEMNAASNDNQFELAQEKKIEVEKLLETTVMERKLYRLCLKTRDISESKIEYHKKKLEFLKCAKYHLLLNIANEYLRHVSPHDVEAMVADENALVCDEDMDWDPEDASNTEDMNSDDEEEERMIMEAEEFVVNDAGNIVYTLENLEDENVEKLVEELVESGLFTEGQINNVRESIDGLVQSGVVDVEDLEDVEDVGKYFVLHL